MEIAAIHAIEEVDDETFIVMEYDTCTEFMQRCLPRLNYQWKGFRKVRKQVCKRITRRIAELQLSGFHAYRDYLENNENEWRILDSLCYITISMFYRDQSVFEIIQHEILPQLAKRATKDKLNELLCWSVGCCSGEEPYTLNILWNLCILPELKVELPFRILATEREIYLLERAKQAVYLKSSIKDLPKEFISQAFDKTDDVYRLKDRFKKGIDFAEQDIRMQLPDEEFDLILCRNLVFTYFQEELQKKILSMILERLKSGGFLIIGAHESLPAEYNVLYPYKRNKCIYRRIM